MTPDDTPQDPPQDQDQDQDQDDIKAQTMSRMRAALDRKNSNAKGVAQDGPLREKAHGSEVAGGGPKMHRRKAGGGGS